MNECDCRQLEAMRSQIDAYRKGGIDLPGLISGLEMLGNMLGDVPAAWIHAFCEKWGVLEEVYSLSVVRESPLSADDQKEVGRAIGEIDAMVGVLLSSAPCAGDP